MRYKLLKVKGSPIALWREIICCIEKRISRGYDNQSYRPGTIIVCPEDPDWEGYISSAISKIRVLYLIVVLRAEGEVVIVPSVVARPVFDPGMHLVVVAETRTVEARQSMTPRIASDKVSSEHEDGTTNGGRGSVIKLGIAI